MTSRQTSIKRFLTLSVLFLAFFSCDKEETSEEDMQQTDQEDTSTFPTPNDADGVLVAVKSVSITDSPLGPIEIQLGTAVGVFTEDGFTSDEFISAGMVSCNGSELAINANNAYTFTDITPTDPTGLDFNDEIEWNVTGANGIANLNYNADMIGFPSVTSITSSELVDKEDGHTLTCDNVSAADSVIFLIGGVTKTLSGNANSCSFTADELTEIGTGANIAQIAAYVADPVDFGTTRIYFVNEYVQSQSVTVE
ncbi:MAG: hypothetical protein HKN45_07690 [Flavobacteriales bacterium]|nr:hypothetical protein [Flavobacteriales bacterium]